MFNKYIYRIIHSSFSLLLPPLFLFPVPSFLLPSPTITLPKRVALSGPSSRDLVGSRWSGNFLLVFFVKRDYFTLNFVMEARLAYRYGFIPYVTVGCKDVYIWLKGHSDTSFVVNIQKRLINTQDSVDGVYSMSWGRRRRRCHHVGGEAVFSVLGGRQNTSAI